MPVRTVAGTLDIAIRTRLGVLSVYSLRAGTHIFDLLMVLASGGPLR